MQYLSASNSSGGGNSILRRYNILPSNNTLLNASFRFKYLDAELNGLSENSLVLWESTDAIHWISQGFTTRNTEANYVELTGVNEFSSWTLSAALNALPLVFGNIKAFGNGDYVIVQWEIF
ncbi:MAG: hypothetical protein WKF89_07815 [Chitinophagaceae bacterium]